ncbi:LytR/AlgR family response regulator transcription factor [Tenacibaculum xiamenense]|uniref:LytR/AlgR family response regulator transcription factor n=1 Tax=Tenacibaculum xiamenense TaxID=1261553 RepID=UPI0038941897
MRYSCIVLDDELLARRGIEDYIAKTSYLEHKKSFGDPEEALRYLNLEKVDVLFLDIQMPDINGFEFLSKLKQEINIIFTTAHREFALEGFESNALDYLLKPISYARFLKGVGKLRNNERNELIKDEEHQIFIKSDGVIVKLLLKDITHFESANDYIIVHKKNEKYLTLSSFKKIEEKIPENSFLRVHRSFLVNLKYIHKIEGNLLHIENKKIPISKNYKNEVLKTIIGDKLIERK